MAIVVGISALTVSASRVWPYDVIEVKDGGTISGEVKVRGDVAPPENIQKPIGTKCQHSSVVELIRLRSGQQHSLVRLRAVRVRRRGTVLRDHRRSVWHPIVIHRETVVRSRLRMKRQSKKSLFTTEKHARGDVKKHCGGCLSWREHKDTSGLLERPWLVRPLLALAPWLAKTGLIQRLWLRQQRELRFGVTEVQPRV